jgi:hypothetical protein
LAGAVPHTAAAAVPSCVGFLALCWVARAFLPACLPAWFAYVMRSRACMRDVLVCVCVWGCVGHGAVLRAVITHKAKV